MHNPESASVAIGCAVHGVQAVQDLTHQVDDEIVFEPLAFEREATIEPPEIATRNVLEREIGLPFDLTVAEHVHDVRVRDVTRQSSLFGEHLLRV